MLLVEDRVKERLSQECKDTLENEQLCFVLQSAKFDIVDSIFFHANEINNELYHYAWQEIQKKNEKQEEIERRKARRSDGGYGKQPLLGNQVTRKQRGLGTSVSNLWSRLPPE